MALFSKPKSDFWKVGIVPARIESLTTPSGWKGLADRISWLPDPGPWRYLADPFAIRRADALHVFVEAYDYRTKHGFIEHHELSDALEWRGRSTALTGPVHLSYPFLIEEAGDIFMVPESHKAGEIALYRARAFPNDWVRETALLEGIPGAEASLIRHHGKWWMFYTLVGAGARDQRELHVAHADRLTGPWTMHPQNPVLVDKAGARPGGTPFIGADGLVHLPVQDCHLTYGGAARFLRLTTLSETAVTVEHLPGRLTGNLAAPDFPDGMHTVSACGDLTLIDVKKITRSWGKHAINLRRKLLPRPRM